MRLYFHHVGEIGAEIDFPKTVINKLKVTDIIENISENNEHKEELISELLENFPEGFCNCWGVPSGASPVISKLSVGDAVFLIGKLQQIDGETVGPISILCLVKVYKPYEYNSLSEFLWGQHKYPFIFFFNTIEINYSWEKFIQLVDYKPKFNPRGQFYSVDEKRLSTEKLKKLISSVSRDVYDRRITFPEEIHEGQSLYEGTKRTIQINAYERNSKAREICLQHYGYSCLSCGFNFEEEYGELGTNYIHVHHIVSLSSVDEQYEVDPIKDLVPVCPNCHAMLHQSEPPLTIEELKIVREKQVQILDK